jgi:transposase InsO family protein
MTEGPILVWIGGELRRADEHNTAGKDTLEICRLEVEGLTYLPSAAEAMRDDVLRRAHTESGHLGAARAITILHQAAWWIDGAQRWLQTVRNQCAHCQIHNKHGPRRSRTWAAHDDRVVQAVVVGHHVHVDHVGPFDATDGTKRWFLLATDAFSRWTEGEEVSSVDAKTTAATMHRIWFSRFGPPAHLTTDQGTAFCNNVVDNMCKIMGVRHIRTSPHHPHANGLEERVHRTLKQILDTMVAARGLARHQWAALLPNALHVLRATRHSVTGCTPARVVLGYELPVVDAWLVAPGSQLLRDGVMQAHGGDLSDEGRSRCSTRCLAP